MLILPCCIGDVVLATATLEALRRAYPKAHITWAVGSWSKGIVEHHPLLNAVLDTGADALPVKSPGALVRFVRQLREGQFDLAVSLIRSPLMSVAVMLSGIPNRVGLDSDGRGFGYTIRAPINPRQPRHEAEIYLDTALVLGVKTKGCWANVPLREEDLERAKQMLAERSTDLSTGFLVIHPGGGRNPGMVMDVKRWPPENFAALAERLSQHLQIGIVLVGGPGDSISVEAVASRLSIPHITLVGQLSFGQLAALASLAEVYIGNDTGMTHLAAAAGARTVMILGPSDPMRYAPFSPTAIALWKPTTVLASGVTQGAPQNWDWARDGIGVEEVERKLTAFLESLKG